jgi:hypothetical protein
MAQLGIFISHSWKYSDHYETLREWIFDEPWYVGGTNDRIIFVDHSVPKDDPIHNAPNSEALRRAIYAKILLASIVVIPTGMYAAYSEWIQKEIDGSVAYGRPILAVNPWGAQKTASVVAEAANQTVGWNKQSVVDGIWRLANGG